VKRAYWLGTLLLVAACSGGGDSPLPGGQDDDDVTADDDQDDDNSSDDDNDDSSSTRRDSGSSKPDAGKDGGAKTDAKAPNDDKTPTQPGTGSGTGIPCDVQAIVEKKCGDCHGAEPKFGAPMSLAKLADFMEKDAKGRPYHEAALARVTGAEKPVMPPAAYALTADEKTKITDWLTKKAPASTASCSGSGDDTPGTGDDGRPKPPTEDETECDVEMEFRAGFEKPFTVPTTPDYYHCFYFKPEFTPETVGKGFWPRIDNDKVIHHWLLFVKKDASKKAGTSEQCTGVNPGATLIAGWAPGGEPTVAPKDVGIDLPKGSDVVYQLELHYNNTVGAGATDRSGVKLCATKNKQKELAAIHYLGSENILVLPNSMGTAQSTCTPKQPVTLLSVNPHMHKTGHHAKMIINRKNGMKETYHDEPFSFDSQVNYNKTAKLEVGDSISASCTFKNDTSSVKVFQEGTNDEMCYLFTLAYPIGAMDTGSDLLGVGLPGPNRCMR
jgi:hypothetical protein